ncbi:MAG: glutathione S-transferase N-terminal domain-containing protein [Myxococcales bacterium]|nr:glutathione S-transferase N-terminal domain-containing protein [Myxococcales bacterium]
MSKQPVLYGIYYSPWTLRARWALDHHAIVYKYREHTPMLGEPILRRKARRAGRAKGSVPLLDAGKIVLVDSIDIMAYADEIGSGPSLRTRDREVAEYIERMEPAFQAVRVRVTQAILQSPEALKEAAAGAVPGFLAAPLKPLAAAGARFIAKKYGFGLDPSAQQQEQIRAVLLGIREHLAKGQYLFSEFSAADIVAATLVQGIEPVESKPTLPPATRSAWRDAELSTEFSDLVEWRDELVTRHR